MKRWLLERLEVILCPTVGCTSFFARWWEWPYARICNPLAIHINDKYEEAHASSQAESA